MKTKIDCEKILALLKSGYLDNELDDATQIEVNQHLEKCPACRQIKENLEAISLALRNTPRANPPENLWARIQKEIWPARIRPIKSSGDFSTGRFKYIHRNSKIAAGPEALALPSAIDSSEGRAAASPPRRLVFFTQRNALALATAAVLVIAAMGFYFGSGRPDNGELAPALTLLIGNDETRDPNMNFGSNIEKCFL